MRKQNKNVEMGDSLPGGFPIDPNAVYDANDCMAILKCGRATLGKYVDEGFPLKPVMTGIAIGQDILDWIKSQPIKRQARGNRSRCTAAQ